jgi:hypothetical protein
MVRLKTRSDAFGTTCVLGAAGGFGGVSAVCIDQAIASCASIRSKSMVEGKKGPSVWRVRESCESGLVTACSHAR